MTPRDKAKELVDKYLNTSFNCNDCIIPFCDIACTKLYTKEAAECALILTDEIILFLQDDPYYKEYNYWQEVKNELLKQKNNQNLTTNN